MSDPVEDAILERLPDGRIRYRNRGGLERTGEQVGVYAITSMDDPYDFVCSLCRADLPPQRFVIDLLDPNEDPDMDALGTSATSDEARMIADCASAAGGNHAPGFLEWLCEMRHRDEPWTPYRHWLRARAS